MYALADLAEEEGDPELANGWRWLADNQRFPSYRRWFPEDHLRGLEDGYEWRDGGRDFPLGVSDFDPYDRDADNVTIHMRWDSISALLEHTAGVLGRWLAAGGDPKSERQRQRERHFRTAVAAAASLGLSPGTFRRRARKAGLEPGDYGWDKEQVAAMAGK
jgi:hypothetical protein